MSKKIRIYAEIDGKLYRLKPLRKHESMCKHCAIKDRRCDILESKTDPCDALYYYLNHISDGNYRIEEAK